MDLVFFEALERKCVAFNFARRRNTFFRVVGDGVLQVIQCRYQRKLGGNIISVGLVSMYGYLQPECFNTPSEITRYSIINCFYRNHIPLIYAIPLEVQLDMLHSQVLPWLDSIDTQKKLIRAMSMLSPGWIDALKIGPYLACGEINHAKKVIREILARRDLGKSRIHYCEDANGLLFLNNKKTGDDLLCLWDMLSRGNPDEINNYLNNNYKRNMNFVKFCKTGDGLREP